MYVMYQTGTIHSVMSPRHTWLYKMFCCDGLLICSTKVKIKSLLRVVRSSMASNMMAIIKILTGGQAYQLEHVHQWMHIINGKESKCLIEKHA